MAGKSQLSRIVKWSLLGVVIVLLFIKVVFIGYYQVPQNGMYPGLPAGSRMAPQFTRCGDPDGD